MLARIVPHALMIVFLISRFITTNQYDKVYIGQVSACICFAAAPYPATFSSYCLSSIPLAPSQTLDASLLLPLADILSPAPAVARRMHLVFGRCCVPTCYNTPLVGLLASILNRLLAAGLAVRHSQVCLGRLPTPPGMGLVEITQM